MAEPGAVIAPRNSADVQFVFFFHASPLAVDGVFIVSFNELNLDSKLLQAIEASGFTAPTDIQRGEATGFDCLQQF